MKCGVVLELKKVSFRKFFAIFCCIGLLHFSPEALAQNTSSAAPTPQESPNKLEGPRKQFALIVYAGLGGAVLGLSTLSFYGRPQDNLANIAIGFAFGVIAGTVYVTYNAATNPRSFYGSKTQLEEEIEQAQIQRAIPDQAFVPKMNFSF